MQIELTYQLECLLITNSKKSIYYKYYRYYFYIKTTRAYYIVQTGEADFTIEDNNNSSFLKESEKSAMTLQGLLLFIVQSNLKVHYDSIRPITKFHLHKIKISEESMIILAVLLLFQVASTDSIDEKFEKFKNSYSRTYTGQENQQKKKIFQDNIQYIEDRQRAGKKVPLNDLVDKSSEELQKRTGLVIDEQNITKVQSPILKSYINLTPLEFDYRTLNRVTTPKNQRDCQSDWAFAAVAYYESMLLMYQQGYYDLSEQLVFQCSYNFQDGSLFHLGECIKGSPQYAIDFIKLNGISKEESFQYRGYISLLRQQACFENVQNFVKLKHQIVQNQKAQASMQGNIKNHLIRYGPMIVGVKANFDGFRYPDNGGYVNAQECGYNPQVDHAVLLVGYKQYDGKEYWIVKNSWGKNWGDNGFGYVPMYMDCGISHHIFYVHHEGQYPPKQYQTLTIQLFETFYGVWTNTVLGFRQDGIIVGTFGGLSLYTLQYPTNKPKQITIQKGKQTSIMVHKIQYAKSQYIGFRVKRQDGSILYQKHPGLLFTQQEVLYVYNSPPYKTYEAQILDTYGDGWNGNTFMIKQGQNIIAELGKNFTTGYRSEIIYFNVSKGVSYQITSGKMGYYRNEIILKIRDQNGNIIFNFGPNYNFDQEYKTLAYFYYQRSGPSNKVYQAQLRDTYGDGWHGNTMLLKQGQDFIVELGKGFQNGAYYGPIDFNVTQGKTYQLTAGKIGNYTTENSVVIRDQVGNIVLRFGPYKSYYSKDIFGNFTVGAVNQLTRTVSVTEDQEQKNPAKQYNVQNQQKVYLQEQQQVQNSVSSNYDSALAVAIVCLSALSIVLLVSLICMMLKLTKKDKKIIGDTLGSASNFKADENAV